MVSDEQVKLLRHKRMEGKTLQAAAACAGMSERSARKWQQGPLPSQTIKQRTWRTRRDPFADVFDSDVVPMLRADLDAQLQVKTIFAELQQRYPDTFTDGQLRSLQRRVRDWRALNGRDKEVYFEQRHPPGREAAFDFTHGTELQVTIAGVAFAHLWFVFRLSFSRWMWATLAFGETFEAMVAGLQGALWSLGGVPLIVRHDNLSAATHELRKSGGRSLNKRFKDVLDHYDLESTRIKPGKSNENGGVEKNHHLFKSDIEQALRLRGSRDFETQQAYVEFVGQIIDRRNAAITTRLQLEREHLRSLPSCALPSYTVHTATVRRWSTISVASRRYSVPSRLIGHEVTVHQHPDHLEVFYKDQLAEVIPRLRGDKDARIDYRHVIWSLVRKPGAFARYRFREELFPTMTFRRAYDALRGWRGERADIEYVRVLHLAAATMQSQVETALELLLDAGERFDYAAVKELTGPRPQQVPSVQIPAPDLAVYDCFLGGR